MIVEQCLRFRISFPPSLVEIPLNNVTRERICNSLRKEIEVNSYYLNDMNECARCYMLRRGKILEALKSKGKIRELHFVTHAFLPLYWWPPSYYAGLRLSAMSSFLEQVGYVVDISLFFHRVMALT